MRRRGTTATGTNGTSDERNGAGGATSEAKTQRRGDQSRGSLYIFFVLLLIVSLSTFISLVWSQQRRHWQENVHNENENLHQRSLRLDGPKSTGSQEASNSGDESDEDDKEIRFSRREEERSRFSLPRLYPGDIKPIIWKKDLKQMDPYGRLIGLPPKLTRELQKFCVKSGLMEQFSKLAYGSDKMGPFQSKYLQLNGGRKWIATTPEHKSNWKNSDLTWIDSADEQNFEEALSVLRKGDFDVVLRSIGKEFDSEGLMIAGIGFILMTHTQTGHIHADLSDAGKHWLDLLFPLVLPKRPHRATLRLGDDEDDDRDATIPLTPNVGILLGGDTFHGTGKCDFRSTEEFRVAVTIYLVDINERNARLVSGDESALFPIPGQIEWFLASRGRFFEKNDDNKSMAKDTGRGAFVAKDRFSNCTHSAKQGLCDSDWWGVRVNCPRSCDIYVEDERYFGEFFRKS